MLKDITLGQYFPGNTVIHRMDPRTKILLVLVYIIALFVAESWISYGVMLVVLASVISIAKISLKTLFKGVKPLLFVIILTAVLNIFYSQGEILVQFWIFKITKEGCINAVFMALRIVMLIMGTFMLTYTTSPIMLTYGIELLLGPLKKIKVPVHELAMMMSMALRLIPTLVEETDKIMSAQKARGAEFDTGNLIQKAKALLPILVPLFISAFRRADELAIAMESRCYHGDDGRTRLNVLKMSSRDVISLCMSAVVLAGVITLAHFGL
ncbi:MAG: energy-coupling factor transporter transmembrane component T family protein [Oscillospiraceae bacterium]